VELQQKLQNLKDRTNVLVRASTRTADMEKTQSNIYATLTELKESIAQMKPTLEKLQSQQTSVPPSSGKKGGEKTQQPSIIKPAVIHHPQSAFQPPLKGVKITEGGQQPQNKPAEPTYTGKGKGIAGEASQKNPEIDPTLSIRQATSLARQSKFSTASETMGKIFSEATIPDLGFCENPEILLIPKESYTTRSRMDSVMDLPVIHSAFNWKIFNLRLGDKEYNEFLIHFYSQIGKDPDHVWRKTYIRRIKVNKLAEKFEGLLQNYLFVLERGSNNESHSVTLADLPLMNPYDIFTIYSLSGSIQGSFPDEFRGVIKNFLRSYLQTVSAWDMVLCECLKAAPTPPNIKFSKEDLSTIKGQRDGRIVSKPEWGVVFQGKLSKPRTYRYNLARMDEKSFFPDHSLTDIVRRMNKNDDNQEKDLHEANDMIFWWMAVRGFLKKQILNVFSSSQVDQTKYQE